MTYISAMHHHYGRSIRARVKRKAFWTFALAVGVERLAYAFASIVLITYMSTLASVEHAASQFGLLTSLCAFPGSILAGFSGFVIEHTGFVWFFIWTSLIGIPVALHPML